MSQGGFGAKKGHEAGKGNFRFKIPKAQVSDFILGVGDAAILRSASPIRRRLDGREERQRIIMSNEYRISNCEFVVWGV